MCWTNSENIKTSRQIYMYCTLQIYKSKYWRRLYSIWTTNPWIQLQKRTITIQVPVLVVRMQSTSSGRIFRRYWNWPFYAISPSFVPHVLLDSNEIPVCCRSSIGSMALIPSLRLEDPSKRKSTRSTNTLSIEFTLRQSTNNSGTYEEGISFQRK